MKKQEPNLPEGLSESDAVLGMAVTPDLALDESMVLNPELAVDGHASLDQGHFSQLDRAADSLGVSGTSATAAQDDEMVTRTIGGDQDAFEVLVRRHSPRVFNIIGSFFRRRDLVEDIAQDVFIKSYTSLASYTIGRSFEAWLARIAVNCCYDHLRAQRRRGEQSSPQDPGLESDWLDLQMLETAVNLHASQERQREAADLADRLMSKLLPEDRIVLVLMDRDGYSVKEISDVTGWGSSKVKVRAFRARRTLRAAMKRLMTSAERKRKDGIAVDDKARGKVH
ncbi:MAG TPA: RNA polymerase sigma factor [Blastocatellia bacterium]